MALGIVWRDSAPSINQSINRAKMPRQHNCCVPGCRNRHNCSGAAFLLGIFAFLVPPNDPKCLNCILQRTASKAEAHDWTVSTEMLWNRISSRLVFPPPLGERGLEFCRTHFLINVRHLEKVAAPNNYYPLPPVTEGWDSRILSNIRLWSPQVSVCIILFTFTMFATVSSRTFAAIFQHESNVRDADAITARAAVTGIDPHWEKAQNTHESDREEEVGEGAGYYPQ